MSYPEPLDKSQIRNAFDRAAATYDKAAVVQRYMADELIDRLDMVTIDPQRILDVGCGTGYAANGLMERYPNAELIFLDIAPAMLSRVRSNVGADAVLICGDGESLPIADHSVDIIFSNAVLQWCVLDKVCLEFARVLRPQGLLTFTSFGPDTLHELRYAWSQVDEQVHVHDFIDMHNIGDVLMQCKLANPVMDVDYLKVTHREFADAMRDLKELGVTNVTTVRSRGLTGKGRLAAVERTFDALRNTEGLLETTYEIVYGHAWAPQQPAYREADGAVVIPVTQLK